MSTRLEVRSVHESTTSPTNTPLWLLPRLPHEEHTIALTLILGSFISIRIKLSIDQAKLSKQSITADAAIRIVLLTLQGCTTTHTRTHSSVLVQRVAYLRGIRMEVRPRFQYSLKRCMQGPKPVLKSRSSTSQTVPQPYQNSELLRPLGFKRGEVLGREGSLSPMCGCTPFLGSPHKNSGLRRCSTRQPTVYSYTASHRSPCIRVDSPTQFHHHRHDHYHHDSQIKYPQCNSKHAISSNNCRGYMISTNSYIC